MEHMNDYYQILKAISKNNGNLLLNENEQIYDINLIIELVFEEYLSWRKDLNTDLIAVFLGDKGKEFINLYEDQVSFSSR